MIARAGLRPGAEASCGSPTAIACSASAMQAASRAATSCSSTWRCSGQVTTTANACNQSRRSAGRLAGCASSARVPVRSPRATSTSSRTTTSAGATTASPSFAAAGHRRGAGNVPSLSAQMRLRGTVRRAPGSVRVLAGRRDVRQRRTGWWSPMTAGVHCRTTAPMQFASSSCIRRRPHEPGIRAPRSGCRWERARRSCSSMATTTLSSATTRAHA